MTDASAMLVNAAGGLGPSLALKEDGKVVGWGDNGDDQIKTSSLSGIKAISAAGNVSLFLKTNGSVSVIGKPYYTPLSLTNGIAIAAGTNFYLALLGNGDVVAWGNNDYHQRAVPSGASNNVVAIAAAAAHALALKSDGTVVAWGTINTLPAGGLSNVMAIAAGYTFNLALKNDGTVVAWGDNTYGQLDVITNLTNVKRIAARSGFGLVSIYSPLLQYPVDVSKDLLLIYNTNSVDSKSVCDYYRQNRPMVGNANVLGIGCTTTSSSLTPEDYTNNFAPQITQWLTDNPTKRPQYVVLFPEMPWRVNTNPLPLWEYAGGYAVHPSVQYYMHDRTAAGWHPFVTAINMRDWDWTNSTSTNACKKYIDKLKAFGDTNSPGKLFISPSAGGYSNDTYVLDNIMHGPDYTDWPYIRNGGLSIPSAIASLTNAGVTTNQIHYTTGLEFTNDPGNPPHLTNAVSVAGYISWGFHSALGSTYSLPTFSGPTAQWSGNSGWWIIETLESFNGLPGSDGGNYFMWFSSGAFGGTDYSNTPVGAVTHTDEPGGSWNDPSQYFSFWARGRAFADCAWNSRRTLYFQAIGDPFVRR